MLVLTCGIGFALSMPLGRLPPVVPALIGYALALAVLLTARLSRKPFEVVAGHLRAAGMLLGFFATLRLFYFGARPVLAIDSAPGTAWLAVVVALNVALALRRRSPWLLGLAMTMGLVGALAVGTAAVVFAALPALEALGAIVAVRRHQPVLLLATLPAIYLAHLAWALNRPWIGRGFKLVADNPAALGVLLLYVAIFSAGSLWRRDRTPDDPVTILAVVFNCGVGYGLMLLQSLGLAAVPFAFFHFAAALGYLGLAVAFWRREASRIATFFLAMTGYLALTAAIVKTFSPPEVFLWLSGQSLVVVATALWFRSRLIVVANFVIFAGIVLAYISVAKVESGISLLFGVVALLTARILNWRKERLELKTELMRNAYLASAFVVFPYALAHIVPDAWVGVSWIGIALAYYAMNLIVRNPKYRWMGHLTLLLTVVQVVARGVTRLAPAYRILSFLALGTVLVVVSLVFSRLRARRRREPVEADGETPKR